MRRKKSSADSMMGINYYMQHTYGDKWQASDDDSRRSSKHM